MGNRTMGRDSGRLREEIVRELKERGAVAVGFSQAGEMPDEVSFAFEKWIKEGNHAGMTFLQRHIDLRRHTDNILPGAQTIISMAFSYFPDQWRKELPYIASYAYGNDYHKVIKSRLEKAIEKFKFLHGGEWRICVDSAPLPERYLALKSGIGKLSRNGNIYIPGYGSMCFLAEILTTIKMEREESACFDSHINIHEACNGCNACLRSCPTSALKAEGVVDSRKCLNYLTIEHRGEWSEEQKYYISAGSNPFFGCDRCIKVCKLNIGVPTTEIEEFKKNSIPDNLEDIRSRGEKEYKKIMGQSAMSRLKFSDFLRNLNNSKRRDNK